MDAQKRSFLRMVSHELRTPLNSIIGFSEIISKELCGPLGSPQYKEYAEHVRQSGLKLLRLVNQVLEIARLEGHVTDLDPIAELLDHAVDDVLDSLRDEIAARRIRVSVDDEGRLPAVIADPRGLRTVLTNLLQNAVTYSPEGGEVRLRAPPAPGGVRIEIEDDGDGRRAGGRPAPDAPVRTGRERADALDRGRRARPADRGAALPGHGRRVCGWSASPARACAPRWCCPAGRDARCGGGRRRPTSGFVAQAECGRLSIAAALDDLDAEFELLGDWEERYRHVIDLGRGLEPLTAAERSDANKVRGCASQVWLVTEPQADGTLTLPRRFRRPHRARPDRHPAAALFRAARRPRSSPSTPRRPSTRLGLTGALSAQRSNGLFSMVERIRRDAAAARRRRPERGLRPRGCR